MNPKPLSLTSRLIVPFIDATLVRTLLDVSIQEAQYMHSELGTSNWHFNGTELRAVAGNFLFSTGANEFAGRYTAGHFDIPVMRTTITVDNTVVVRDGVLQDVFG